MKSLKAIGIKTTYKRSYIEEIDFCINYKQINHKIVTIVRETQWCKLQQPGPLFKPKQKIQKMISEKIYHTSQKKLFDKNFLCSRMGPDLVYYLKSTKTLLVLS